MTTTTARARIRDLLNQSDNTNTQFSDNLIDYEMDTARHLFATILPEEFLPKLRTGESATLPVTSGVAAYPSDFLRSLGHKVVWIDAVVAKELKYDEEWRLKFLESNYLTKTTITTNKYYREIDTGIKCYPGSATAILYPYLKRPTTLSATENYDLPTDIDYACIDFAFEKVMGTKRGDVELALKLARDRGYLIQQIQQKNVTAQ